MAQGLLSTPGLFLVAEITWQHENESHRYQMWGKVGFSIGYASGSKDDTYSCIASLTNAKWKQKGCDPWARRDPAMLARRKMEIREENLLLTHHIPAGTENQHRLAKSPTSTSNYSTSSEHLKVLCGHTRSHRYLFHWFLTLCVIAS